MSELDFEGDVASFGVPTDDEIQNIAALAQRQKLAEEWIAAQEEKLKEARARLRKISEELLPDAMKAAGVEELKLSDGSIVEISESVKANIAEKRADEAFAWMREHGFEDLIRNEFKVTFGKGENVNAEKLAEFVSDELKHDYKGKKYVHHSTLPAFVRQYMAEGKADDYFMNLFGVFVKKVAKISDAS